MALSIADAARDRFDDGLLPSELLELIRRPAWHAHAACRGKGPQEWFPGRGEPSAVAEAICSSCPMTASCLAAGVGGRRAADC
jgi:hypothetical protein